MRRAARAWVTLARTDPELDELALRAAARGETVLRRLAGLPVRGAVGARIDAALGPVLRVRDRWVELRAEVMRLIDVGASVDEVVAVMDRISESEVTRG